MEQQEFNKAYAVAKYVESLGLSVGNILSQSVSTIKNEKRKELIDHIHAKAIESIDLI